MKTYIVKDTIINLKTKEIQTYYFGKDGYVHDELDYVDGYTRPVYAQDRIKREVTWYEKLNDNHALESNNWLHIYNIIEYEKGE